MLEKHQTVSWLLYGELDGMWFRTCAPQLLWEKCCLERVLYKTERTVMIIFDSDTQCERDGTLKLISPEKFTYKLLFHKLALN